jgi:hypothetical protein
MARRDVQKMEDQSEPLSACDLHELLLAHSPEGALYRYGGSVECTPGAWCRERCAARHISPLGWNHVGLTGDYNWHANKKVAKVECRPCGRLGQWNQRSPRLNVRKSPQIAQSAGRRQTPIRRCSVRPCDRTVVNSRRFYPQTWCCARRVGASWRLRHKERARIRVRFEGCGRRSAPWRRSNGLERP